MIETERSPKTPHNVLTPIFFASSVAAGAKHPELLLRQTAIISRYVIRSSHVVCMNICIIDLTEGDMEEIETIRRENPVRGDKYHAGGMAMLDI